MDFNSYQKEALRTDRVPARDGADEAASLMVPMLGLAGETGQLLSEYKKSRSLRTPIPTNPLMRGENLVPRGGIEPPTP